MYFVLYVRGILELESIVEDLAFVDSHMWLYLTVLRPLSFVVFSEHVSSLYKRK